METKRFYEVAERDPDGNLWVLYETSMTPGGILRFGEMVASQPKKYRLVHGWMGWELLKCVPSTQAVEQISQGEEKL